MNIGELFYFLAIVFIGGVAVYFVVDRYFEKRSSLSEEETEKLIAYIIHNEKEIQRFLKKFPPVNDIEEYTLKQMIRIKHNRKQIQRYLDDRGIDDYPEEEG